jgi:hypothetical protein
MAEPASAPALRRALGGVAVALALAGQAAAAEPAAASAAAAAPKTLAFEPKTQVDGAVLQVIFGERALFRLDTGNLPVLDRVEKGQLAAAHPAGTTRETFAPPGPGLLAAALDGSAENQASVLKIWNRLGHPVQYAAIALVLHGQTLHAMPVPVCPIPAGGVRVQTWPAPVVAVGLSRFKAASKEALAQAACSKGK